MKTFEIYFLMFFCYSIIGWFMEGLYVGINQKRFINRGFLIGPYCPIYGFGAILITILLRKYLSDPIALFIMAIVICSIVEYGTSYIMEKIFKARWWDYSSEKFNLNGRVCLKTIVPFGIVGCLAMYVVNPFIIGLIEKLSYEALSFCSIIFALVFITDTIFSMKVIYKFVGAINNIHSNIKFDSTEQISKRVKQLISEKKSVLLNRLIDSFPKIKSIKNKKNKN